MAHNKKAYINHVIIPRHLDTLFTKCTTFNVIAVVTIGRQSSYLHLHQVWTQSFIKEGSSDSSCGKKVL